MITILNGKLTIPERQRFIGFAGDNLARTIRFLLKGQTVADRIYRLYLTFDDESVNFFTLPSVLTDEGVELTWEVEHRHIFKSGNIRAQIKAFSGDGVVYHTNTDTFIVGNSAEFSESIKSNITEYLEHEQKLNSIAMLIRESAVMTPYVGENGNWYIYDSESGGYIDSNKPSAYKSDSTDIADGAITSEKLADKAIDRESLFDDAIRKAFLSLPLKSITVAGDVAENFYNQFTSPGVYQIDSVSGVHNVLVVFKPDSDAYLMQILLSYNKILYRGIFCSEDGVYADEDWEAWTDLSDKGMEKADKFYLVSSIGESVDPQFIAYQTDDKTTDSMLRIPMSLLRTKFLKIKDEGEYFVSETVEGALQELGAELKGVSTLLAAI